MLWTIQIGETIADKVTGTPLPTIKVEEPTVRMSFSINTSPFVGREVCLSSMLTKNMLYLLPNMLFCVKDLGNP